ncbi:unnamed protein product [Schistosoma margrebowiei]|uniref:Uncharacterized protein n=1 Tax=Schistosoma margrebowiei TaxID=48269 RepID=A0A183MJD7_9TREM|nr:unnamed protein product [Schistosoma margrebowiei]
MRDVRIKRAAEIASDHHPVLANLNLKLNKPCATGQTALPRFNTPFLRDTNKIALSNEFSSFKRSTEGKRNYYGGQLEMYQGNITIKNERLCRHCTRSKKGGTKRQQLTTVEHEHRKSKRNLNKLKPTSK